MGVLSKSLRSTDRYFSQLPGGAVAPAVAVYVLLVLFVYWYAEAVLGASAETLGQFGDYLSGTLNPFFSLVALVFVARTWLSQQRASEQASTLMRESALLARRTEMLHRVLDLLERLEDDFADTAPARRKNGRKDHLVGPTIAGASLTARRQRLATHMLEVANYLRNVAIDERAPLMSAVSAALSTAARRRLVAESVHHLSEDHRLAVSSLLHEVGDSR